jgi:hypothetical protein
MQSKAKVKERVGMHKTTKNPVEREERVIKNTKERERSGQSDCVPIEN